MIRLIATWWFAIVLGRFISTTLVLSASVVTLLGLLCVFSLCCFSFCCFGRLPIRSFSICSISITVLQGFLIISSHRLLSTPSLANTIDSLYLFSPSRNRLSQTQDVALDSQRRLTSSKSTWVEAEGGKIVWMIWFLLWVFPRVSKWVLFQSDWMLRLSWRFRWDSPHCGFSSLISHIPPNSSILSWNPATFPLSFSWSPPTAFSWSQWC